MSNKIKWFYTVLMALALAVIVAYAANAETVQITLGWDQQTGESLKGVRIYEKVGDMGYSLLSEVSHVQTSAVISVETGAIYTFIARTYYQVGDKTIESDDSNSVSWGIIIEEVKGLKILNMTITPEQLDSEPE